MLVVSDDTFDQEVMNASGLVLVAYVLMSQEASADLLSLLSEVEQRHSDHVKFVAVDVERNKEIVHKARIWAAPMIAYYCGGQERHLSFHPIEREMVLSTLATLLPN